MRIIPLTPLATALLLPLVGTFGDRTAAHAQASGATLEVTVISAEDLRPLAGARVMVAGLGIPAMTDQSGRLVLTDLPMGNLRVEVRYLGYQTSSDVVSLETGRRARAEFRLQIQPIELTGVNVRVRSDILLTRGFYDRQKGGQGTFLTRADLDRSDPRFLSDVLRRIPGVQIGAGQSRPTSAIRGGGSRSCPIQYFLDGALTSAFNVNDVSATDVEGLEIYRGAATVPPMYNKGTANCGVILIWTRID